jgi:hypothetical protein
MIAWMLAREALQVNAVVLRAQMETSASLIDLLG